MAAEVVDDVQRSKVARIFSWQQDTALGRSTLLFGPKHLSGMPCLHVPSSRQTLDSPTMTSQPLQDDPNTFSPQYLVEFPDFGELDVVLPKGFEDQSHHDSSCPCFALAGPDTDDTGIFLLTISVDYADPAQRRADDGARFAVYHGEIHSSNQALLTEDWAEVLEYVRSHRPVDEAPGLAAPPASGT
jgi:hypothetical protein